MAFTRVVIDANRITSWDSFHDVFAEAFGFPGFYGRNMDAWNDSMTSLNAPEDGLTSIHVPPGGVVVLELLHAGDFAKRCPDMYAAVIECSAFVNHRRLEAGKDPVLMLSFYS